MLLICLRSTTVVHPLCPLWHQLPLNMHGVDACRVLHYAAAADRIPWLEWLLKEDGMSVNDQDNAGNTPLHAAAHNGSPAAVLFLLEENADCTIRNGRWALSQITSTRSSLQDC